MKRAFSWIEFLITFGLFIASFVWMLQRMNDYVTLYRSAIENYILIQKATGEVLYTIFKSKNINNSLPLVISPNSLSSYSIACTDCIRLYKKNSCIIFNQTSNSKINSDISLILIGSFDVSYKNATINCYDYLNTVISYLQFQRNYKYCTFSLKGNSSISICNLTDVLILDRISTFLPIYFNNNSYNAPSTYYRAFISFFITDGYSIFRKNIYVR